MPRDSADYCLAIVSTSPPIRASAIFPATFLGFQGHFPTGPILPGFFHIQLALDILRELNLPFALQEISTAKFTRPVTPHAAVTITLMPTEENTYDVVISDDADTCSSFTVRCSVHKS